MPNTDDKPSAEPSANLRAEFRSEVSGVQVERGKLNASARDRSTIKGVSIGGKAPASQAWWRKQLDSIVSGTVSRVIAAGIIALAGAFAAWYFAKH